MSPRYADFARNHPVLRLVLRYGGPVVAVTAALGMRWGMERVEGPGLPTYITFYPAVMAVAIFAGFGPGMLATLLACLATAFWILPPAGWGVGSPVDRLGLVLFFGMGLFMSAIADLYRRSRAKAAAYDREAALRESREELRAQREWLRVTLTSIGDAVITTDTAGLITFLNPVAQTLTGWPEQEAKGRPIEEVFQIINEQTREPAEPIVQRVLREGCVITLANHTALLTRNGREVAVEDSAAPIRNAEGRLTGVVVVFHDVSEKRRAQQALRESEFHLRQLNVELERRVAAQTKEIRRANETLEQRIAERTAELQAANASLQESRRAALNLMDDALLARKQAEGLNVELQHAQEGLLQAKEEWERTFDCMPDLVAILDDQHRILRANKAMALGLGLAPEQCVGRHCYEVVHGLGCPPDSCPHRLTVRDGQEHAAELHEERLGGDFEVTTTPLRDPQGRMVGTIHIAHDITERKRAERVIVQAARRFEILSETASELLQSAEPRNVVETLCRKVMEYLDCHIFVNYLVDEQAGRLHLHASAGLPVPTAQAIEWLDFGQAICGRVAQEGKRIVAENIEESCDARADLVRSFGIRAYACHPISALNRVIGTVSFGTRSRGTFTDDDLAMMKTVTDQVAVAMQRVRAEQALRELNETLERRVDERTAELREANAYNRSLLEASLDPLVTIAADGKITDVNAATEKITGLSRRALIGTDFSDYFTDPEKARAGYQRVFREGFVQDYALEVQDRAGNRTPVLYNACVYRDAAGKVLGVFAAARDITERRRVEEELRRLNEELEHRVAARTAELAASNKELEAFAYSVSHDLRAPLRAMDGFSQVLLEDYGDKLDADGMGHLQRVRMASQRMGELIDGMLNLSRMTRSEMRRTAVDLSGLAQMIGGELHKIEPDRAVELVVQPRLIAHADANLMRILLANLLGNAWKFTGRHPRACIEVGSTQRDGETVYYVRDDGAGFDMKYVDTLFGAFRRLHSEAQFEGTGVGLATVQRIVHRHGGQVWAEGAVEKGAAFYFTLPSTAGGSPEARLGEAE